MQPSINHVDPDPGTDHDLSPEGLIFAGLIGKFIKRFLIFLMT
jgi:hypothetical protein